MKKMKEVYSHRISKILSIIVIFIISFCFLLYPLFIYTAAYPKTHNSPTDYQITKIGQLDTGYGSMVDLFVTENYVYSAIQRAGLVTFNIANLSSPSITNVFDDTKEVTENQLWDSHSALTRGIFVVGDIAYLADGSNGLVILNISSPEQPFKIGQYSDDGAIPNIFVQDSLAFVYGSTTIKIIDVSNVKNPTLIGKIDYDPTSGVELINCIAVYGDYLFVGSDDLIIFDLSNPSNPVEVNRLEDYKSLKLTIHDDSLFSISSEQILNGFRYSISIYNIENPITPLFHGECTFEEANTFIQSLVVSNHFAYIASYEKIFAINITNYNIPLLLDSIQVSFYGLSEKKLALQADNQDSFSDIVFCADYEQGLLIYNFTNPMNPKLISNYDLGQQAKALYTSGDFAYLCTSREFFSPTNLDIISLVDPSHPTLLGRYTSNGSIMDVVVSGDLAFLALRSEPNNRSLEILDISDPVNPHLISCFNATASSNSLKIKYNEINKLIILANNEEGYSIINVMNISQPTLLYSARPNGMNVVDIDLEDNLLFLADGRLFGGFGILDISNPSSPTEVYFSSLNTMVFDIKYESNRIYLTTDSSPLVIFDASNISNPKKIGSFTNGLIINYGQMLLNATLAYVAREANGLIIIGFSNPRNINSIIEYRPDYSGLCYDVAISKNYLLLADGWDGLEMLELISPIISKQVLLILSILPPSIGFSLTLLIAIRIILKKNFEKSIT